MPTSRFHVYTLDAAYKALEEVFPNHPLIPAARQVYLSGRPWRKIGENDTVGSPKQMWYGRISGISRGAPLFWDTWNDLFNISTNYYLRWIFDTVKYFGDDIMKDAVIRQSLVATISALQQALARDYRYFGENEKATKIEDWDFGDSKNPSEEMLGYISDYCKNLHPKEGRDGYALSKRLCNRERPLLLKSLCDFARGAGQFLSDSGRAGQIPTKFRLFFRSNEMDDFDQFSEQNLNGLEALQDGTQYEHGSILTNVQFQNDSGRALCAAIAHAVIDEGGGHNNRAYVVAQAFFWQNYDDYFEYYLHDLVKKGVEGFFEVPSKPHYQVIHNYPGHYFNTGELRRDQKLSSFMKPYCEDLWQDIGIWDDSEELSKDVLGLLQGNRATGSRSGVTAATTPTTPV